MTQIQKKRSGSPDDTMTGELGVIELFDFGGSTVARFVFEPGWRYSTAAVAEGYPPSCPEKHFAYQVTGVLAIRMEDGEEVEIHPGEIVFIPEGHEAWVVGDEPVVMVDWAAAT